MSSQIERFGQNILTEGPFTVEWNSKKIETVPRKTRDGREYTTKVYYLVTRIEGFSTPIEVGPISEKNYQSIRVLAYKGFGKFAAVRGMADKEGGFSPLIFSGVKA